MTENKTSIGSYVDVVKVNFVYEENHIREVSFREVYLEDVTPEGNLIRPF